ncbi:MAG: hypothetical protein IJA67_07280 [Oscillospiraceae bacterium]|nr:hypothetical protein [Oscillospiraceae bacterium]
MYKCKCCGHETLHVPPEDAVAYICPICWWENDVFTADDDEPSDENHGISLNRARKNYIAHGICDPQLKCKDDIHLSTFAPVDKTLEDHMPFLVSLEENSENELHIVLSAAVVGENTPYITDGLTAPVADAVSKCSPILPGNRTIDIRFDNYIMYQVRNESYVSPDRTEARHGKYLCVYAESKLLAYLETVTDVQRGENGSTYPGPCRHYGIRTQNQIIDVVSHFEPMVTVTESGES